MIVESKEILLDNGLKIVLRSATEYDAKMICEHRYITSGETYFMARYPEECTFDVSVMAARLKGTKRSSCDFTITAFLDKEVIGDLAVSQLEMLNKYRHRAYIGIAIRKQYCNIGLGSIMLEYAIKQAKYNGFEQLELDVFEDNIWAIHLYKKFGFLQYGIHPKAIKLKDGTYRDELMMVKML